MCYISRQVQASDDPRAASRGDRILSWLVFAAAVGLRLPSLLRPLYLDEFATLEVLGAPTFGDAMELLRNDTHHPLYFALLYFWAQVSDESIWLRTLSLIFDMGALAWLYVGLRQVSSRSALMAVALWGACPVALRFSTELRPYAPLACFAVAAWVLAHHSVRQPQVRRPLILLTVAAWLCLVATHPVGILAIAAIVAALAIDMGLAFGLRRGWVKLWRLTLPGVGAGGLFALFHWWFTYDPSGSRISWMPKLSGELIARILNYSFGTDGGAPWALLGTTWTSTHAAGIVIFVGLIFVGMVARNGRAWALAAFFDFLVVAAVSLVARPIFWYRSIVPALIYATGAGAVGLSRLSRWGVGTVVLLVTWQAAIWLPRATRAIDPTALAGSAAVEQLGAQESVYVFPDWMYITVRPFLEPEQWAHILPCGGDPNQPDAPLANGVAIARCSLDMIPGPTGFAACLKQMRDRHAVLHDLYVFLDDDDDMYATSQNLRLTLIDTVQSTYGPCTVEDPNTRIVHLACPAQTP